MAPVFESELEEMQWRIDQVWRYGARSRDDLLLIYFWRTKKDVDICAGPFDLHAHFLTQQRSRCTVS